MSNLSGNAASRSIEVVPVAGRIGAEIRGVQLSASVDEGVAQTIHAALLRHKVIFLRDQHHLDDAAHEALAARLGDPLRFPIAPTAEGSEFLLNLDTGAGYASSRWHTDTTFLAAYPAASILRPIALPRFGGDTTWANTAAAYAQLPRPLKRLVAELDGLHSSDLDLEGIFSDAVKARLTILDRPKPAVLEAIHPVVRVHPETGEPSLVLGEWFRRFVELDNADSRRLYEILQDHVTLPENTVRWRWRLGDLAIWDNRATQHRVIADYGDEPRNMRRATILGDIPRGLDGRLSREIKGRPERLAAE
jgi:taurine dioxygenase